MECVSSQGSIPTSKAMAKTKNDVAAQVIAAINKGFKGGATRLAQGAKSDVREVIPTGLENLDKYVLGVGGLPVGRISELFSEEGAGKTTILLQAIASCQRMGGLAILTETETALDSQRAKVFGVDLDSVVLLQPDHIPEAGQQIELALQSIPKGVGPVLVGWDSVAATMSKQEAEEGLPDKESFDKRAKEFSAMMRVLGPLVAKSRCHLMLINQVRANIGVMFGDKFTTPCGKAIKFHASIRLQMYPGKAIKDAAGQHEGKDITIIAVKNKLTRPFRKTKIRLWYDRGFDNDWGVLNHAKDLGLIDARNRDVKGARTALDAADWYRTKGGATAEAADKLGDMPSAADDDDEFTTLPPKGDHDPEGL